MAHEGLTQTPTTITEAGKNTSWPYEVATGGIADMASAAVFGTNPAVPSTGFVDVWDAGGVLVYPTTGESWEVVSDSIQDSATGTGAATVLVQCLTDDYAEAEEILALDGVTPVAMSTSSAFRFRRALVLTAGSGASVPKANAGTITFRVAGGGATRAQILPGNNNTLDSHYTVPAGKVASLVLVYTNINKNEDAEIKLLSTLGDGEIFSQRFAISVYQDSVVGPIPLPAPFIAKSDIKVQAKSSNTSAKVSVALQFVVEDGLVLGETTF